MEPVQHLEFDEKAIEGLELLLHEFWILRAANPAEYQLIREREKVLRRYLDDKFGLLLIVHQHFIKLEKIPVTPEEWMGLGTFIEKRDYILFSYAMAFLEDKSVGEQFLLSELAEEISHYYGEGEGVDWTIYTHRKSLIRTIKTMTDLSLMKTVDGNIQQFDHDQEQEVLYETTIYSKYFIRSFPKDLTKFKNWQELLHEDWNDHQEDERRKRVYRQLFFSPGVHRNSAGDADFTYLRTFRNRMIEEIEKHSRFKLRLYKNTALLTSAEPNYRYDYFPDTKAVTDIILHLSHYLYENRSSYTPLESGDLLMTAGDFDQLLSNVKEKYGSGWAKKYREAAIDSIRNDCLAAMRSWMMVEMDEVSSMIYIRPLLRLLAGDYPDDYIRKGGTHEK